MTLGMWIHSIAMIFLAGNGLNILLEWISHILLALDGAVVQSQGVIVGNVLFLGAGDGIVMLGLPQGTPQTIDQMLIIFLHRFSGRQWMHLLRTLISTSKFISQQSIIQTHINHLQGDFLQPVMRFFFFFKKSKKLLVVEYWVWSFGFCPRISLVWRRNISIKSPNYKTKIFFLVFEFTREHIKVSKRFWHHSMCFSILLIESKFQFFFSYFYHVKT